VTASHKTGARNTLERKLLGAFVGALTVVILLSLAVFDTARQVNNASQLVDHTHEVLEVLDGVDIALVRAESAVRGYIITGNRAYTDFHRDAVSILESGIQKLGDMTADNEAQRRRWRILLGLLNQRSATLDRIVIARQTEGADVAGEAFAPTGTVRRIRSVLDDMRKEERQLLALRTQQEEKRSVIAVAAGMFLTISFVLLFTLSYFAIRRQLYERKAAEEGIVGLNRDLAARALQLETANKELESFSYSVSHDLRAPLRAVAGFSRILVEDHSGQLDEEAKRKLSVIQDEAHRMGQLIDELLAFSHLGRKAMNVVELDITELARATYAGLEEQHECANVELRLASLPRARGDRVLLGQVWANLLSNAVKFSSKRDRALVEVSAISDDKEHVFSIRDNGAGFDPRYRSKLFGVFQRLHHTSEFPGTGVGLALVQRIVARHGGRVWAEGSPGQGATFYFTLPREDAHGAV